MPVLLAMGATGYAGYELLLSAGEQTVPAGTAALVAAAAPGAGADTRTPTRLTAPAGEGRAAATVSEPERTRTHTLTPPLFQLLYAPIYQAPRLSPAGTPVALRPIGAR